MKNVWGLVVMVVLVLAACGDDDVAPAETTSTLGATSSDVVTEDAPGDNESDGEQASGGAGTVVVTVSAGTYELEIVDDCVLLDVGIGLSAMSDEAEFGLAGFEGAVNINLDLPTGEQWLVIAAPINLDGTTITYEGPATVTGGAEDTMSVVANCN